MHCWCHWSLCDWGDIPVHRLCVWNLEKSASVLERAKQQKEHINRHSFLGEEERAPRLSSDHECASPGPWLSEETITCYHCPLKLSLLVFLHLNMTCLHFKVLKSYLWNKGLLVMKSIGFYVSAKAQVSVILLGSVRGVSQSLTRKPSAWTALRHSEYYDCPLAVFGRRLLAQSSVLQGGMGQMELSRIFFASIILNGTIPIDLNKKSCYYCVLGL